MHTIKEITSFEVPAGKDEEFLKGWNEVAAQMRQMSGVLSTRLHESLDPQTKFRFVAVTEWESSLLYEAARRQINKAFEEPAPAACPSPPIRRSIASLSPQSQRLARTKCFPGERAAAGPAVMQQLVDGCMCDNTRRYHAAIRQPYEDKREGMAAASRKLGQEDHHAHCHPTVWPHRPSEFTHPLWGRFAQQCDPGRSRSNP